MDCVRGDPCGVPYRTGATEAWADAAELRRWEDIFKTDVVRIEAKTQAVLARDPTDAMFIACAHAGNADWIVSGDRDVLEMPAPQPFGVLSVRLAAALLGVPEP